MFLDTFNIILSDIQVLQYSANFLEVTLLTNYIIITTLIFIQINVCLSH